MVRLRAARILVEREAARRSLPAEEVAGIDVLEAELLGHQPGNRRLAAASQAGDGDQHSRIMPRRCAFCTHPWGRTRGRSHSWLGDDHGRRTGFPLTVLFFLTGRGRTR